jgi:hypothetical protein
MTSLLSLALKASSTVNYKKEKELFVRRWEKLTEIVPDADPHGESYCDPCCHCAYQPGQFNLLPIGHIRHLKLLTWRLPFGNKQWQCNKRGKKRPVSLSLICYNAILLRLVDCFRVDCDLNISIPPQLHDKYLKNQMHKLVRDNSICGIFNEYGFRKYMAKHGWRSLQAPPTPIECRFPLRRETRPAFLRLGSADGNLFFWTCPLCNYFSIHLDYVRSHIMGRHYSLKVHNVAMKGQFDSHLLPELIRDYSGPINMSEKIEIWTVRAEWTDVTLYHCCHCGKSGRDICSIGLHIFRDHVQIN